MNNTSFLEYKCASETLAKGLLDEPNYSSSSAEIVKSDDLLSAINIVDYSVIAIQSGSLGVRSINGWTRVITCNYQSLPAPVPASARSYIRLRPRISSSIAEQSVPYLIGVHSRGVDLASLKQNYFSPDWFDVQRFIGDNFQLAAFLRDAAQSILDNYPRAGRMSLEYFYDRLENWEKLYLIVQSNEEDPEKICDIECDLFSKVFDPKYHLHNGEVVLSLV